MTNDWIVTVKLINMPDDADEESIKEFTRTVLDSNTDIEYEIIKVQRMPE